jgi:hypothetical protein
VSRHFDDLDAVFALSYVSLRQRRANACVAASRLGISRRANGRARYARLPLSAGGAMMRAHDGRIDHLQCRVGHAAAESASRITSQMLPLSAQRRDCRKIEFQLPNSSGRSRHGAPVRINQNTASSTRRAVGHEFYTTSRREIGTRDPPLRGGAPWTGHRTSPCAEHRH